MCLTSIKELDVPKICYKLFLEESPGVYIHVWQSEYSQGFRHRKCAGNWYKANRKEMLYIAYLDENVRYESGYHSYISLEQALSALKAFKQPYDSLVLLKVEVDHIICTGYQEGRAVVVSNKIKILPNEDSQES